MKKTMVTSNKPREGQLKQPPIALLLAIDAEYRDRSARGHLPEMQFHTRDSVHLPVLQTRRRGWQIMAHRGRRHDDLVVHYRRGRNTRRKKAFLYTGVADEQPCARLVVGREEECAAHYQGARCQRPPRLSDGVRRGTVTLLCALVLLPVSLVISENAITQDSRPGVEIAVKNEPGVEAHTPRTVPAAIDKTDSATSGNDATKKVSETPRATRQPIKAKATPVARTKVETIADRSTFSQGGPLVSGALADAYQLFYPVSSSADQDQLVRTTTGYSSFAGAPTGEKPGPVSLNAHYRENGQSNPGLKAGSNNRDSYVAVDMKSKMLKGTLTSSAQLAYSSFDPRTEFGLDDDANRSIKLGMQGKYGRFKYGTAYQSTGGNFEARKKEKNKLKKGRENWESWTSVGVGDFSVKTSYAQRESNIDNNPNRPHYTEDEARVTLSHTLSQWPYFGYSVSYGQGGRDTTKQNGSQASGPMNRTGASLDYSSNNWSSSLGTYRLDLRNDLAGGLNTDIQGYYLSGSYYPSANFSVSPAIDLSNEYYESDSSRTSRQSFSLSATRSFDHRPFDITAYGQYYTDQNDTWSLDTEGVYAETGIVWNLGQQQNMPTTLGLHLTYNAYTDNVYADGSVEDIAAWLVFKLNEPNTLLRRAYQSH